MNIAIFASGNGSNAENIINYFNSATDGAKVALVLTNRPQAGVIDRAERLGVPVEILAKAGINDPAILLPLLERYGITHIVLAGFLLMIPTFVLDSFPDRVINIHPSLLPRHGGPGMYGRFVHQSVVEAGDKETGITIHFVSDRCDDGRIIFQASVPVDSNDTPEMVEARIHELEKIHFPRVIAETFGGG